MRKIAFILLALTVSAGAVSGQIPVPAFAGAEAYAGPEFNLIRLDGEIGVVSGGDLIFRLDDRWSVGVAVAYPETPDIAGLELLVAGIRTEARIAGWRWFDLLAAATVSAGFLDAGASGIALFVDADLPASFGILPGLGLSIGPGYRFGFPLAPGSGAARFSFSSLSSPFLSLRLRYSGDRARESLLPGATIKLAGFYDATFLPVFGQVMYLDGGGTQVAIGDRFLVGPCGGITRAPVVFEGRSVDIMYTGARAEYAVAAFGPLGLSIEATCGAAFPSSWNPSTKEYRSCAAFFARPMARVALMAAPPFGITLGFGYDLVVGSSLPGIDDVDLDSFAFSVGIRNR